MSTQVGPNDSLDYLIAAHTKWQQQSYMKRLVDANKGTTLYWRAEEITDILSTRSPMVAACLIRWDSLHPQDAFSTGFIPLTDDPETAKYCLADAKLDKKHSAFVFTTNCYAERNSNGIARWVPRSSDVMNREMRLFEYEIFAYGGLEVDRSFPKELGPANSTHRKGDVAFLGGIRPQFIHSAVEYDKSGRMVRYWLNGSFDMGANVGKENHMAVAGDLLPRVHSYKIPVTLWTKGRRLPVEGTQGPTEDVMATLEGTLENIEYTNSAIVPIARAFAYMPGKTDEGYFFTDTCFIHMKYDPQSNKFKIIGRVMNISEQWKSLDQLGFATVDEILPIPKTDEAWFYCGGDVAKLKVDPRGGDALAGGPGEVVVVASNSLRQAGFATIDAVVMDGEDKAILFRGTLCVIVDINNDRILEGPLLTACRFPALANIGFTIIDTSVPVPNSQSEVFVFCGDKYIKATTSLDTVLSRPNKIDAMYWEALTDARFY